MAQSPFPGMDPYLESPGLWPDVHVSLMNIFREQLTPLLVPKYVAELETQIVIEGPWDEPIVIEARLPDVTVTQPRGSAPVAVAEHAIAPAPLRRRVPAKVSTRLVSAYIRLRESDKLVAVIELLSPYNKRPGQGRQEYLDKRTAFFDTGIHLIEIDLLRRWSRMPLEGSFPKTDYLAIVANRYERPYCDVWPIYLRQPLPVLPVPLVRPDPDVPLNLGQALRTAYERARYDLRIDYTSPPDPPLSAEDAAWAAMLLEHSRVEG